MDRKLRDRRISIVAAAGVLACLVVAIGMGQTGDVPAASHQIDVTSDARGQCKVAEAISPGERVELTITYGGALDDGLPGSIRRSYPLEVQYLLPKVLPSRSMEKKIFDYNAAALKVKDGRVLVDFTCPKGVQYILLKFSVLMNGGSLLHESADRDWATVVTRNDEDAETFTVGFFVED